MKKSGNVSVTQIFKYLIGLLFENCKLYLLISVLICSAVGLATSAQILIKQWFFEAVSAAASGGSLPTAVWWGIFMGVFMAGTLAIQGVSDVIIENTGLRLGGFFGRQINEKAARVDPICFENPDMLNDINRAYQGVQSAGEIMQNTITNAAFYVPYFIFFSIYLFRIQPVLCFGMLLVFIPTLVGPYIRTRFYAKLENTAAVMG